MDLVSWYRFPGAGSTRPWMVEPIAWGISRASDHRRAPGNPPKWTPESGKGFFQQVVFESGTLFPCSKPIILDKDWESRVRTMEIYKNALN